MRWAEHLRKGLDGEAVVREIGTVDVPKEHSWPRNMNPGEESFLLPREYMKVQLASRYCNHTHQFFVWALGKSKGVEKGIKQHSQLWKKWLFQITANNPPIYLPRKICLDIGKFKVLATKIPQKNPDIYLYIKHHFISNINSKGIIGDQNYTHFAYHTVQKST